MAPLKANWGNDKASFTYEIEAVDIEAGEMEIIAPRINWMATGSQSADDVLNAVRSGEGGSVMEETIEFLKTELADGTMSSKTIFTHAHENGLSDSTINRAKK